MIAVYPLLYQVSANRHQPYFDLFTNVHLPYAYLFLPQTIR